MSETKLRLPEAIRLTKEIEKKFSLEKYMLEAGINFKPSGSNRLSCCCPLHNEKTPSFVLYRDSNSFCCFGACHVAGGVVKFVKLHKKWGWFKTVKYLANKIGISTEMTEEDFGERQYEDWIDSLSDKTVNKIIRQNELDEFAVNYKISTIMKELDKRYGHILQVRKKVDETFKVIDDIFVSENKTAINKITKDLIPSLKEYKKTLDDQNKKIVELAQKNKMCSSCWLHLKCSQRVVGEGDFLSRVMFLGEAPGAEEDEKGRPFIGLSGRLLRKTIELCGYQDSNIWIDNVSNCRPPNNEFQAAEAKQCKILWLERRMSLIKPKAIMLFGTNAGKTFLNNDKFTIGQNIGRFDFIKFENQEIEVWYNYHPSYLVRSGGENGQVFDIFKKNICKFLEKHIRR